MAERLDSPSELDREVAIRRQRLERDLQELQARLSPGQLLDEGMMYLRRSQGADFFRNLGAAVRDRPLPIALVGVGLTWLAASGAGPNARTRAIGPNTTAGPAEPSLLERAWDAGRAVVRSAGETQAQYGDRVLRARAQVMGLSQQAGETADAYRERVETAMDTARDKLRAARDRMTGAAADSYDRVTDAVSQGYARASDTASQGYARAQDYAGRAGDTATRAAGTVGRTGADVARAISDNPILLGAVGMVAGALLGALLPRSRTEEDMLRPVAQSAADTARNVASEVMEHGERVARTVVDAGVEATQKTADTVRQAVDEPAQSDRSFPQVTPLRREPERVAGVPPSGPRPNAVPERERERQAAGSTPIPGTDRAGETGTAPMIG